MSAHYLYLCPCCMTGVDMVNSCADCGWVAIPKERLDAIDKLSDADLIAELRSRGRLFVLSKDAPEEDCRKAWEKR